MTTTRVSGEIWRWLLGLVAALLVSSVTWTWAVAGMKQTMERSVETVSVRVDAVEVRQKSDAAAVDRRLVELETLARMNQQLLVAVESLKTEIRYLAANVAEIKADLKDEKRKP